MPTIFVDFRPAEVVHKKETYVSFYVKNPLTCKLERRRIRCNHVNGAQERLKYARLLCSSINQKLYEGWNPFYEEVAQDSGTKLEVALEKFINEKNKEVRPDTMRVYTSIVGIFRNWLNENKLNAIPCFMFTKKHAERYLNSLADNPKIGSRSYNNYLRCLKTVFLYMQKRDFIKDNPFSEFVSKRCDKKIRTIIPKEDRARIKEYVVHHIPVFYYVILMCYRLFGRPKEILMLKIGMYDPIENVLTIPPEISKNHNARMLALPDELRSYFESLKSYPSNWYIFSDADTFKPGKVLLNSKRIGRIWGNVRDALGLPACYQFYSLKDTGITEMLEAGVPAKFVKELADHHSLEMTEKYTHKSEAKKILEWNKLEF
ncbi:MAG: tyrosine-type recombinase/integrase [Bacteroidales bacterium]|nr:tyrosine-type recombinase/integrase [Bacteroidales bacterium]